MFSRFRTLRALLLLASLSSPVFSSQSSPVSALSRRSFGKYIDNLLFIDGEKENLYVTVEDGTYTYAARFSSQSCGLVLGGDDYTGNAPEQSQNIEDTTVKAKAGTKKAFAFLDEVWERDYLSVAEWPSTWPSLNNTDIHQAVFGWDSTCPDSPAYDYLEHKYGDSSKQWFFDLLFFAEWMDPKWTSDGQIDFVGLFLAGETLSWPDVLDISQQEADSYGLPRVDGISNQPRVPTSSDGTFSINSTYWISGRSYEWQSQTGKKAQPGSIIADINTEYRWTRASQQFIDNVYGKLSNAKYIHDSTSGYYSFDCDATPSLTLYIGANPYAISSYSLTAANPSGEGCIGSIWSAGEAVAAESDVDLEMGFQLLSNFYIRSNAGVSENQPYYQFLPLEAPSGWSPSATSYMKTDGVVQSTTAARVDSVSPTGTSKSATGTGTGTGTAVATQDVKVLGAAEDEPTDSDAKTWHDRAKLYEIIIIVLGSVLALGIVGAVVACFVGRRKGGDARGPSAYRTIVDAESREPKAPLYGAEGGSSRYDDPYEETPRK